MKRIIFHIGTHKTATTTIQATLSASRARLQAEGIFYPPTDQGDHPHPNRHLGLFRALEAGEDALNAERDRLLEQFEASGCDTLLLSDEHLSSVTLVKQRQMAGFGAGYQVEVVCLLRRQDQFLEAMWNQLVKRGKALATIDRYYARKVAQRMVRYDRILDVWAEFAKVSALSFDAAKEEGVMQAFCRLAGLPALEAEKTRNVSPSANCALTLMQASLSKAEMEPGRIMQAFGEDKSRHVLGRHLRQQILADMSACNQHLDQKYGVRFSADLPDEQDAPLDHPDPAAVAQAMAWLSMNPIVKSPRKAAKGRKKQGARKGGKRPGRKPAARAGSGD